MAACYFLLKTKQVQQHTNIVISKDDAMLLLMMVAVLGGGGRLRVVENDAVVELTLFTAPWSLGWWTELYLDLIGLRSLRASGTSWSMSSTWACTRRSRWCSPCAWWSRTQEWCTPCGSWSRTWASCTCESW